MFFSRLTAYANGLNGQKGISLFVIVDVLEKVFLGKLFGMQGYPCIRPMRRVCRSEGVSRALLMWN